MYVEEAMQLCKRLSDQIDTCYESTRYGWRPRPDTPPRIRRLKQVRHRAYRRYQRRRARAGLGIFFVQPWLMCLLMQIVAIFRKKRNMLTITEIRVSWAETTSLPEYNNVKPALSLTAQLDEDDDPEVVYRALMDRCRVFVQEEVDCALERAGKSARYSPEPRFDVFSFSFEHVMLIGIAPAGALLERYIPYRIRGARLTQAHAAAEELRRYGKAFIFCDCSSGDMTAWYEAFAQAEQQEGAGNE